MRRSLVPTKKWVTELLGLVAALWEKIWAIYFVHNNLNHSFTSQARKWASSVFLGINAVKKTLVTTYNGQQQYES